MQFVPLRCYSIQHLNEAMSDWLIVACLATFRQLKPYYSQRIQYLYPYPGDQIIMMLMVCPMQKVGSSINMRLITPWKCHAVRGHEVLRAICSGTFKVLDSECFLKKTILLPQLLLKPLVLPCPCPLCHISPILAFFLPSIGTFSSLSSYHPTSTAFLFR